MILKHVIESQQFTVPMLVELFNMADGMERFVDRGGTGDYSNRIMASLFYEHSTRTRFSFESAMLRLGGKILATENANQFSSLMQGETLEDSVRVVANYSDVIVIRHNEVGGAARAAEVSSVPVINAGDGEVDVVYMTRLEPAERIGIEPGHFFIDESIMKHLPHKSIVMHPLPRANEISATVDRDPRAAYFRQTRNGILVRMALLVSVLDN